MAFSSLRFFAFLAAVLLLLSLPLTVDRKKRILAVASCLFYAAWDYRYLALLIAVSVIDYYCAARIDRSEDRSVRFRWVSASVVSNLSLLAYFKYFNFFAHNLNGIMSSMGVRIPFLDILLPAGISFYTFKSMSYTIDVYRREIPPCQSQIDYTTFVTFFPELIAGPIVRASVFLPQMSRRIGPTTERLATGGSLFLLGLTKKTLIADRVAIGVDQVFATPQMFSGPTLWLGVIGYAVQIYCDFSGYSDMAIGTARMIGYDLPENFNMPYLALNITEFWRRWHMTLSSWLRDYLYIPLGGNRGGRLRTYVNLMLTMLLGGLWHGASWNFVLWGSLHGLALAAHKLYRRIAGERRGLPAPLAGALTFLFVTVCWVPFRAPTFEATRTILRGMFSMQAGARWYPDALFWSVALLVAGHILGYFLSAESQGQSTGIRAVLTAFDAELVDNPISRWSVRLGTGKVSGAFLVTFWLLLLFFFAETNSSPFIYFQF